MSPSAPNAPRWVGLDVGGTHVRVATRRGDAAAGATAEHALPGGYDAFLAAATGWIGVDAAGVGVGLPGRVAGGRAVWVPNVPWLDGRALADDLAQRTGTPVTIANDAQCALLAEVRSGAARGGADTALVAVGTGIGGAIARGGRIVAGTHGTAGAFGWLPARPTGPHDRAPDGARGPWERLASGSALQRRAEAAGVDASHLRTPSDPAARAFLEAWLDDVARGLAGVASALDPQRVLLSGGVAELLAHHLPELRKRVREAASPVAADVEVLVAAHGPAAGALGATFLAAEGKGAFLP
jgi:predicted NBD/HSP70 family sugar kinase